jgi:hypothetical protein
MLEGNKILESVVYGRIAGRSAMNWKGRTMLFISFVKMPRQNYRDMDVTQYPESPTFTRRF